MVAASPVQEAAKLLALPRTAENRGDLSEFGIKGLRDFVRKDGTMRPMVELKALLAEEITRIHREGCTPDVAGLHQYFRARRVGSTHRISRAERALIFAHVVGKGYTGGRWGV